MLEELDEPTYEQRCRIELEARDKRRLEAFIDAVFAIAITLLGLEFVVPSLEHSDAAILDFLGSMYPKLLGYFLAFFLLGILLNSTWRQFQNIQYADWKLYFINILFLAFIVLMPFATSLLTEYGETTTGVLFFNIVVLLSVLTLHFNWSYVKRHPVFLKKGITPRTLTIIHYQNISLLISSAMAIVLSFFTPLFSILAYALIIVIAGVTLREGSKDRQ